MLTNARTVPCSLDLLLLPFSSETVKTALFMWPVNNSDAVTLKSKFLFTCLTYIFYSSTIYLYAMNDPVIEASSGLKFAPFNCAWNGLAEQSEKAGLDPEVNKWELVFDFSPTGTANFS